MATCSGQPVLVLHHALDLGRSRSLVVSANRHSTDRRLTFSSIFSDLPVDQAVGDGVGYADSVTGSGLAGFGTNPDQTGYANCNSGSSAIVVFSVDCDLFSRFPLS